MLHKYNILIMSFVYFDSIRVAGLNHKNIDSLTVECFNPLETGNYHDNFYAVICL